MKKLIPIAVALALFGAGCSSETSTPSQPTEQKTEAPAQGTTTTAPTSKTVIDNILVSDTAGSDSYVEQTKDTLDKNAKTIFVTAQIADEEKDKSITAEIADLTDGTKFEPQVATSTDSGNVQQAFSFINADPSWTVGSYQATITLSNGATKTAKFEVK